VSRYLQRLKRRPDKSKVRRWLTFLQNHRQVIAAFDFFTVPTLSFRVLYCFFVIEHHRRRILHFNATAHPTSDWILQQLALGRLNRGPTSFASRGQRIESVVCITGTLGQRQRRCRSQAVSSLSTRSPFSLTLCWAEFQMECRLHALSVVAVASTSLISQQQPRPAWTFDERQDSNR
jgi:hypothetical protein